MDFKQLKYFVRIAELGNMTRASEALCIAQPALSQQIANLEAELGTRLFDRSVQGVRPTQSGDVLYRHAKSLLKQFEDVRVAVSEESGHPSGRGVDRHSRQHRQDSRDAAAARAVGKRRHPAADRRAAERRTGRFRRGREARHRNRRRCAAAPRRGDRAAAARRAVRRVAAPTMRATRRRCASAKSRSIR